MAASTCGSPSRGRSPTARTKWSRASFFGASAHRPVLRLRATCGMTFQDEITDLRARITRAESQRDRRQASGMQEKYLEACSLVQALELQLEGMRQEGLRAF